MCSFLGRLVAMWRNVCRVLDICINKNTFCGTRYLSHCCSLHGTVVAVRDPGHAHIGNFCQGSSRDLGTRLPNLKFVTSAVLELLAFNAQKFLGSRD